jgi:hypothetical protein
LLPAVERQYGAVVDLGADYYWTVGAQEAFRFGMNPEVWLAPRATS